MLTLLLLGSSLSLPMTQLICLRRKLVFNLLIAILVIVDLIDIFIESLLDGRALWQRFQFGWINIADTFWRSFESETDKRKFMNYYSGCIFFFI